MFSAVGKKTPSYTRLSTVTYGVSGFDAKSGGSAGVAMSGADGVSFVLSESTRTALETLEDTVSSRSVDSDGGHGLTAYMFGISQLPSSTPRTETTIWSD